MVYPMRRIFLLLPTIKSSFNVLSHQVPSSLALAALRQMVLELATVKGGETIVIQAADLSF